MTLAGGKWAGEQADKVGGMGDCFLAALFSAGRVVCMFLG